MIKTVKVINDVILIAILEMYQTLRLHMTRSQAAVSHNKPNADVMS